MVLTIGEILFDLFPAYKRLGGAPFNFAAHLKAFGLPVLFASRIGEDENGKKIMDTLQERGFDSRLIQVDATHATGHVRVEIDEKGSPDFDIVENVAYDYLAYTDDIAAVLNEKIRLIYFGTLIQRNRPGFETIQTILKNKHPQTRVFYDINLRPDSFTKERVHQSLIQCDILKLSDEELTVLQDMFDIRGPMEACMEKLREKFDIEWISLTRGGEGSMLFTRDRRYSLRGENDIKVVDTVGAGDAWASVLAAGYLREWDPATILRRANRFAAAVCGIQGAVPEEDRFYQEFSSWMKGGSNP